MNCPGHCVMFDLHQKSYRDLPIRMADFGVLHRNELKGALTGLTRVRRFQQDDAHIFCMPEQIEEEILGVLDFIDYIYSVFGFEYKLNFQPDLKNIWVNLKIGKLLNLNLKTLLTNSEKNIKSTKEMELSMVQKLISNFSILSEDNINAEPANLTSNFQSDLTSNTEPNKLKKKRMSN